MTDYHYMDIKDIAKEVRAQLKAEFPGFKFGVRINRYSMGQRLEVFLMEAPRPVLMGNAAEREYEQINPYALRYSQWENPYHGDGYNNGTYLTQEAWEMLKRVDEIANQWNWDNSDVQSDYFDVNYYFNLHVGRWDKPFQVTK